MEVREISRIICIQCDTGATTLTEYRDIFDVDGAVMTGAFPKESFLIAHK